MPYRSSGSRSASGTERRQLLAAAAAGGGSHSTNVVSVGNGRPMAEGASAVDTACSCNCTCVSRACCRSATAVVHEGPALKLGGLKAPNSTFVSMKGHFR